MRETTCICDHSDLGERANTATYTYRADALRSTKAVSGTTTTSTWDLNSSLPEAPQDGSETYVYGPLGLISQTDGSGNQQYFLNNGLGSTEALRDGSGNIVATYKYDVFGAVRSSTGSASTDFRFTGQQNDAAIGYTYLRARYYDPATGRFLSKDPVRGTLTDPAGQHYYVYAGNDPANLMDPSGLFGPDDILRYAVDKRADMLDYQSRLSLRTVFQDTIALGISLASGGDRRSGQCGFIYYENSEGLAALIGNGLDTAAFTPGYIGFATGVLGQGQVVHENQHYLQSESTGPFYLFLVGEEVARAASQCGLNQDCIHRVSILEQDASRAEREGLHTPFLPFSLPQLPPLLPLP